MKNFGKYFYLLLIAILICQTADVSAQTRRKKMRSKRKVSTPVKTVVMPPIDVANTTANVTKMILHEDNHCNVEKPFVYVARNAETFDRLKKSVGLKDEAVDFSQNAVVAVFLGTKPTSGYSVEMTKSEKGLSISTKNPPKGAMLAQVLTSPCQVRVIPVATDERVNVSVNESFQQSSQTLRVESGEINVSGGFAPIERQHKLSGKLMIWREGDLVTVGFDVKSAEVIEKSPRIGDGKNVPAGIWNDLASGSVSNGNILLPFVMTGDIVPPPLPSVRAEGSLTANALSITLTPNPTNVSDGYEGRGFLKASKK